MRIELSRITYEKDGFVIAKARVLDGRHEGRTVSVKGLFPAALEQGLCYEASEKLEHHPKYGEQFALRNVVEVPPVGENGMLRYLQRLGLPFNVVAGLLRGGVDGALERAANRDALIDAGATEEEADNIVGRLTEFDVARELSNVPGFGAKRIAALAEWAAQGGHDLSDLLQQNPYHILEAPGIGWTLADAAALGLGVAEDDPRRLAAAPAYALLLNERDGHTWMPADDMLAKTAEMLGIPSHRVVDAIARPDVYTPVVMDGDRAWSTSAHRAERGLADGLLAIMDAPSPVQEQLYSVLAAGDVLEGAPFPLTDEQRQAVAHCCTHKISVLTGGAGTGKSSITRLIVDAYEAAAGKSAIVLCSPTGKAAKRLSETTGRPARTIHSTVYGSMGGGDDSEKPRIINEGTRLVVVDEASMLDIHVGEWLLRVIPRECHIVFVGDDNQLPSVGPGRVLNDIQQAGVPTFRLEQTHRNDGAILTVVYGALRGNVPPINNDSDVLMHEVPDAERIPDVVCRIVAAERESGKSVRVIAPQRSRKQGTGCGWNTLNLHLQEMLNPPAPNKSERRWFGGVLREGDELLWTENNRELGLVNGDDVLVKSITTDKHGDDVVKSLTTLTTDSHGTDIVELSNGKSVPLNLLTAVHGYACTTHKSQGSEYDVVVFVCHSSHQYMLTRRLVYTALSRAKTRLYIVGERAALDHASYSLRDGDRNTALVEMMTSDG